MLDRRHHHHGQRRLVVLADDQDVAAALGAEDDGRRVLDRDRVAQPGIIGPGGLGPFRRLQQPIQERVLAHVRRAGCPRRRSAAASGCLSARGHFLDLLQVASRFASDSQTTWKRLFPSIMPLASL